VPGAGQRPGSRQRRGYLPDVAASRVGFHQLRVLGPCELFDVCPGPTGDATTKAAGVLGGPLLTSFVVGLDLPRGRAVSASMTLWPSLPAHSPNKRHFSFTESHVQNVRHRNVLSTWPPYPALAEAARMPET
jgi:hypothetical protein